MEVTTANVSDHNSWPEISSTAHISVGVFMCIAGITGVVSNTTLLGIHFRLRDKLLDPTGILICNLLLMNLGISIMQFPFAASSSFAQSWLYGDQGCQLYGAAGFFFGIGIITALGLIILEGFLIIYGVSPLPRHNHHSSS